MKKLIFILLSLSIFACKNKDKAISKKTDTTKIHSSIHVTKNKLVDTIDQYKNTLNETIHRNRGNSKLQDLTMILLLMIL